MKTKIIYTILALQIFVAPVIAAQSIKVSAITEFNSKKPTETMQVITQEKIEFKNGITFENGTLITGTIIDVKQPKRGKLDASFKFKPTTYTYNGKTEQINDENFIGKYKEYKELNKAEMATKAATSAGGIILQVPFFSQGISLLKGMWKNQESNRLKSGVVQVYKDSPLTYVEEGKDIEIKEDDIFILKFKCSETDEFDSTDETSDIHKPEHVKNITNRMEITSTNTPQTYTTKHPDEILDEVNKANKKQN